MTIVPNIRLTAPIGDGTLTFPLCPLSEWDRVLRHNGIKPKPASVRIAKRAEELGHTHLIYEPMKGIRSSVSQAVRDAGWADPVLLGYTEKHAAYGTRRIP